MFFDANGDSTGYIDEIYAEAFCLTENAIRSRENEILVEGLDTGLCFSHLTSGDFTASERFVVIE